MWRSNVATRRGFHGFQPWVETHGYSQTSLRDGGLPLSFAHLQALADPRHVCRRVGRGRDAAIDRARRFTARDAFLLKLDIRKYFDSISHSILLSWLERLFKDDRLLDLFARIVGSYPGRWPPGIPERSGARR